jgi:translocation and assembly module TamB
MSSAVRLTRAGADLDDLTVYALGGRFDGRAEVPEFRRFHAAGRLTGVSIEALNRIEGAPRLAWSGAASGPISVEGSFRRDARDIRAQGQLAIVPKAGATPIQGQLQIAYDQRTGELSLGDSQLTLGSTRAVFRGAFGQTLCVSVRSRNLKDLLPAIGLFDPTPPASLPVDIVDGVASFEGMIQGPVQSPRITGKVTATNLVVANRRFDRFVSAVDVGVSGARLTGITLEQNAARLTGTASIGLRDWKTAPDSPISAEVKLERGDLAALIRESGTAVPVKGALSGTLQVSGTWGEPVAIAKATVDKFAVYDEQFDRLRAEIRYRGAEVEIVSGNAVLGDARLEFSGAYDHPANDWKNGLIRFQASSAGVDLRQVRSLARFRTDLAGNVQLKAAGSARVIDGAGRLTSLDGRIAVTKLVIDKKPTGDILVNAESRGDTLTLAATGDLRGSKVTGKGEWRLVDGYPGGADVQFSRIEFSTLADLLPGDHAAIPAAGYIEGRVSIAGPALKPEALEGTVELTALEVAPVPSRLPAAVQGRDLSLHNDGPIVLDVDGNAVRVRSAQLIGDETRLTASGSVSYRAKTPWDLRVEGSLNLAVLRSFRPDILTGGSSTVDARVRGTLDRPQLFGSVDLKNASFFLENVPNGIENANGRIFFDNNRATIQSLTAETGGGAVTAGGFVGFGGEETAYRLNFKLDRVRVRYPEGVSTTVNASIGLNGTSANSLMTGTVSIVRLGFNPRSDLGSLLAESAKPISTPNVPSPFLQGMQFDVRIETAPNVEFQTALTQDIQAEADLRLRGSGTRPVVLGHVSVNQGEINFFGTKYAINHGEISFFNPVKIEPVLDLDLETKVRAVEVTIHIAGPINKLNVSYRSDPPLQSNEIIALLAVGRAPDPASLAAGQTVQSQTFLDTGANTLLGQAIAAPVSSRLQRFFGVSRLKIDPQLTTLENTPQARLTLEQQISRDITLTYITNLANAQQQIVRIEWNINRSWSVVAVREENGIFGVDFLYKKRFK